MRKIVMLLVFAVCVSGILVISYGLGFKTGEFKTHPKAYWQGVEDSWYSWETLVLKKLNGKWTKFYDSPTGIRYDSFKSEYVDSYWTIYQDINVIKLRSVGSGVTLAEPFFKEAP